MNERSEFLLSIDLEDVRDLVPDGHELRERVPAMVERLLAFLRDSKARITFFTTGPVAVRYKSLVGEIISEGHEIATHGFWHKPLDEYTPEEFDEDLQKSLEVLAAAGANTVQGFRAPVVSMTARTTWVYQILARRGIVYSSSVLPARNPLFGWPEFGGQPKPINGVLEIPISVERILGRELPFASGIYFRVLPRYMIRREFARARKHGRTITAYLHPYDFDPEQERFITPRLGRNPVYHFLMHYNRAAAFDKLRMLLSLGLPVSTYGQFWRRVADTTGAKN
jgi:polysaccharide deacetylase family protein (PEP-CTERM system associated)